MKKVLSVVDSIPTLKAMAKKGLITLHEQTGKKITGLYGDESFTCYYVEDGKHTFQFGAWNHIYIRKYVDGCFCPYIFRVTNTYAAFEKNGGTFAFLVDYSVRHKIDTTKYFVERI